MIQTLNITRNDGLFDHVVRHLHDRAGHYYQGIHAKARGIIADGSYINDAGQRVWHRWEFWDFHGMNS